MANFFKKLFGKSETKVESNIASEAPKNALVAVANEIGRALCRERV